MPSWLDLHAHISSVFLRNNMEIFVVFWSNSTMKETILDETKRIKRNVIGKIVVERYYLGLCRTLRKDRIITRWCGPAFIPSRTDRQVSENQKDSGSPRCVDWCMGWWHPLKSHSSSATGAASWTLWELQPASLCPSSTPGPRGNLPSASLDYYIRRGLELYGLYRRLFFIKRLPVSKLLHLLSPR